jgi:protein-S-isoprenylcysteine O-methyltransferase Ste14
MRVRPGVMRKSDDTQRDFFEGNRKLLTRAIVVACAAVAFLTHRSWEYGGPADIALRWAGYCMVLSGVLGRLWCTLYIGGRKNDELVTEGPYSMCRNPLYFFSFVAGLGITVTLQNLVVIALLVVGFALYYPSVIRAEEKRLAGLFGARFDAYRSSTPSFFPKPALYRSAETREFQPRMMKRALKDSIVFLAMPPLADLIGKLHESGYLPVLFRIP